MKKSIFALVVFVLISMSVFAQVDVNVMFGQVQFNAFDLYYDGSETEYGTGARGLGPLGSNFIGFGISASTEYIGIQADIELGSNGVELGNNVKVWWQPIKWLKLTVGKYWEDDLRGTNDDGVAFIFPNKPFNVNIFDRFSNPGPEGDNADVMGLHLALTPINGLYIGAGIPLGTISNWEIGPDIGNFVTAYKKGQYAVGYNIPGIGHIRAQYIGSDSDNEKAQVAFKLSDRILQGFSFDFGATIPIGKNERVSDDGGGLPPGPPPPGPLPPLLLPGYYTKLAAFIGYNGGTWKLETYTTVTIAKDNVFTFDIAPAFPKGKWTFGADLGFKIEKDATEIAGGGWTSIKVRGAEIKGGIGVKYGIDKKDFGLSIPIQITFGELFGLKGTGGPALPPLPPGGLPPDGLPPIN
jgi:hypothetical protein